MRRRELGQFIVPQLSKLLLPRPTFFQTFGCIKFKIFKYFYKGQWNQCQILNICNMVCFTLSIFHKGLNFFVNHILFGWCFTHLHNFSTLSAFYLYFDRYKWMKCYLVVHDCSQAHDTNVNIIFLTDESWILQSSSTRQSVGSSHQSWTTNTPSQSHGWRNRVDFVWWVYLF